MNLLDLLYPRDESCMKDEEIIESMGAVTENFTDMISTTSGFDYIWDQSEIVVEEPLKQTFKNLLKAGVSAFPDDRIPEIFRI